VGSSLKDVNQAWVKLYKYDSSEEIIGKHFSVIQQLEDREEAKKIVEEIMKGNENHLAGIFSRKCKDGSIGYHSFSAKPVFDGNEVIGLDGFIIDITEKQLRTEALNLRERQFSKAEVVAGFGHWMYHIDDQLISASKGASNIYGLNGSEWSLEVFQKLPLFEYREILDQKMHRLIEYGEPYNIEFQICRPNDKSILWVHSIAEYDSEQKTVFGILHDITLRKLKESALEKQFWRFCRASKNLGLIAMVGWL